MGFFLVGGLLTTFFTLNSITYNQFIEHLVTPYAFYWLPGLSDSCNSLPTVSHILDLMR